MINDTHQKCQRLHESSPMITMRLYRLFETFFQARLESCLCVLLRRSCFLALECLL